MASQHGLDIAGGQDGDTYRQEPQIEARPDGEPRQSQPEPEASSTGEGVVDAKAPSADVKVAPEAEKEAQPIPDEKVEETIAQAAA